MKASPIAKALIEEIRELETEMKKNEQSLKSKIKRKKDQLDTQLHTELEEDALEWIKDKPPFYVGLKIINPDFDKLLSYGKYLIIVTGDHIIVKNGSHEYTVYPCIKISNNYADKSEDINSITISMDTVTLQGLRTDMLNVDIEKFMKIYNDWMYFFNSKLKKNLQQVPMLTQSGFLLPQQMKDE